MKVIKYIILYLVPVPVPTFKKVMVPVPAPYLYHKKQIFLKKFVSFLHCKLFYKGKYYKYQQIYCKMWKKKFLNEGNQIPYIIIYLVPVLEP
jgi:hypothetical protein